MNTTIGTAPVSAAKVGGNVRVVALMALIGGLALVFTTGFAHPDLLHNAAHDWRHSMSFPCH